MFEPKLQELYTLRPSAIETMLYPEFRSRVNLVKPAAKGYDSIPSHCASFCTSVEDPVRGWVGQHCDAYPECACPHKYKVTFRTAGHELVPRWKKHPAPYHYGPSMVSHFAYPAPVPEQAGDAPTESTVREDFEDFFFEQCVTRLPFRHPYAQDLLLVRDSLRGGLVELPNFASVVAHHRLISPKEKSLDELCNL